MTIDTHHHFWRYSPNEYAWIGDKMGALRRDFLPDDLAPELARAGVDGVVSVQARQTLVETTWLLDLAARHSFIKGVVGWVALAAPDVADKLARLAANPKLKGVRHVVQAEPDDAFLERDAFNRGVAALAPLGLVYDILIVARQLPAAIHFVDRHPHQRFVLNHLAKPPIKSGVREPWAARIRDLARRPNVWCKLSGMVTETDFSTGHDADLRPYFDVVLEAFGPQRLLFGSDWPVCLAACDYGRWHSTVARWIGTLSVEEQFRIWGGTAREVYSL